MTCRFLDLVDVKFDSGHKKKKKSMLQESVYFALCWRYQ